MCLVTVQGDGKFEMTQSKYRLSEEQKHEDGERLFDFCAECLKTFIDQNSDPELGAIRPGTELSLGFTVRPRARPLAPPPLRALTPPTR